MMSHRSWTVAVAFKDEPAACSSPVTVSRFRGTHVRDAVCSCAGRFVSLLRRLISCLWNIVSQEGIILRLCIFRPLLALYSSRFKDSVLRCVDFTTNSKRCINLRAVPSLTFRPQDLLEKTSAPCQASLFKNGFQVASVRVVPPSAVLQHIRLSSVSDKDSNIVKTIRAKLLSRVCRQTIRFRANPQK